jgi:hypothetical protein
MDGFHRRGYHLPSLFGSLGAPETTRHVRAWLALAAVWMMGCSEDPLTELVVAVDSDLAVPGELQSVRLWVAGPSGDEAFDRTVDLTAAGAPGLPLTLSLTPGSDALEPVVIMAVGSGPGGASVERRVETGFVRGERRLVSMLLLRACVGVTCPLEETCTAGGSCVDWAIPPEDLPPWTGEPGGFDAGVSLDAGTAMDAATDAGMDQDAATDAATDGSLDGGCTGDEDCLDDIMGPCMDECSGCTGEPLDDCFGTCDRTVTSHSCMGGDCVPSEAVEAADCVCVGAGCIPDDPCMENATCTGTGSCLGESMTCPVDCSCDPDIGVCVSDDDGTYLCALQ